MRKSTLHLPVTDEEIATYFQRHKLPNYPHWLHFLIISINRITPTTVIGTPAHALHRHDVGEGLFTPSINPGECFVRPESSVHQSEATYQVCSLLCLHEWFWHQLNDHIDSHALIRTVITSCTAWQELVHIYALITSKRKLKHAGLECNGIRNFSQMLSEKIPTTPRTTFLFLKSARRQPEAQSQIIGKQTWDESPYTDRSRADRTLNSLLQIWTISLL